MMYVALKHCHTLSAILMALLTFGWSIWAWGNRGSENLSAKDKAIYLTHRAVAGIAGISGIAVMVAGDWPVTVFIYIGVAAFLIHGLAASASKRLFGSEKDATRRQWALCAQVATLVIAGYVMAIKPV